MYGRSMVCRRELYNNLIQYKSDVIIILFDIVLYFILTIMSTVFESKYHNSSEIIYTTLSIKL